MSPRELVLQRLGHSLSDAQVQQLTQALEGSLPAGEALGAYVTQLVSAPLQGPAWAKVLETVLVTKTDLFRHPEQLRAVKAFLARAPGRAQSVWSAACSTGEEPTSLAACLRLGTEVMATDIGTHVLKSAMAGSFPRRRIESVPERYREHFVSEEGGGVKASPALMRRVRFEWSDLRDPSTYPRRPAAGWDVILCRNALFYFTAEARTKILGDLSRQLSPSGLLFLGPAEQAAGIEELELVLLEEEVYAYRRAAVRRTRRTAWVPTPPLSSGSAESLAGERSSAAPRRQPSASASAEALARARALEHEDPAAALKLVEHASSLADLDPHEHWAVGRAYRRLGANEGSVLALRRALLLAPELWEAAFQLAGALFDLGRYGLAGAEYARTRRLVRLRQEDESFAAEADAACRRQIAECERRQAG